MRRIAFAILSIIMISGAMPASAQVVITQAKALAGNITPGDTAGYPITLSQPGAYVLGSNLTVPSGTYGIYAGVDNVDIDLNGFVLSGGGVGTYGIISSKAKGHIHGGVISQFSRSGIYIRSNDWTIEDMMIVRNAAYGVDGYASATVADSVTIRRSTISYNGAGISLNDKAVIEENTISENGSNAVFIFATGRVERNQISNNRGNGIIINDGGLAFGNTILKNDEYAIANGPVNVSLINNYMYNNNPNGPRGQIYGGFDISGNVCVGKRCYVP